MRPKQAKAELKEIMSQQTVRISRLKKILKVLDYERLEKQYIQQGFKNKRLKEWIRHLEKKLKSKNS